MTASLLVLVPIALLVLVASLYFVGCNKRGSLDARGHDFPPFTEYGTRDVLDPSLFCVAYWPLWDPKPSDPTKLSEADERVAGRNGEYRDMNSHASQFPIGTYATPDDTVHSASADGVLTLGASGIVPGETLNADATKPDYAKAIQVDGGYVFVPVEKSSLINPAKAFSLELWARPEWTDADGAARRILIDSRDAPGGATSGFGIWVNDDDVLQGVVGTGTPSFLILTGPEVVKEKANYIVLTFDGATATLFVNGVERTSGSVPAGGNFAPNTTQPLTIGVGITFLPVRNTMSGNPADAVEPKFPTYPFKGTIQCVAIYSTVLDQNTITKHFEDGQGLKDEANAAKYD
jgi:hypothetical protein